MKITEELANEIMEGLFRLALSAYGNTESEWVLDTARAYALQTFEKLMDDWEGGLGMEWEIIKAEPTMWVMDKESHRYLTYPKEKITSAKRFENVVEVVRCKECIHYWKNKPSDDIPVCLASPKDDAFCSEGERREDG